MKILITLFFVLMISLCQGQIDLGGPPQKNKPTATKQVAQMTQVNILWKGSFKVQVVLGTTSGMAKSGEMLEMSVKSNDGYDLKVVTPSEVYTHNEYVYAGDEELFIEIELINGALKVFQGTAAELENRQAQIQAQARMLEEKMQSEKDRAAVLKQRESERQIQAQAAQKENVLNAYKQKMRGIVSEIENSMVIVESGSFKQGCIEDCGQAATVNVGAFKISKFEVSFKQWMDIMGIDPLDGSRSYKLTNESEISLYVSTFSGREYCETCPFYFHDEFGNAKVYEFIDKLNALTGKNYRLPSAKEWEFASRGGVKSKGYKYAGSNSATQVGWVDKNSKNSIHDRGLKTANELGLFDMTGNVAEIVEKSTTGRSANYFAIRGGNITSKTIKATVCDYSNYVTCELTVAVEQSQTSLFSYRSIGFRLVLDQ